MRIHNLYSDANGESHFRDIEVEWAEERRGSKLSKRLPATGIIFRETLPDNSLDWHPAPRRQYIVNLEAGVRLTASDGESRVIGTGEVILVEDTTGKGHLSHGIGGNLRRSLFSPGEGRRRCACGSQSRLTHLEPPRINSLCPLRWGKVLVLSQSAREVNVKARAQSSLWLGHTLSSRSSSRCSRLNRRSGVMSP